MEKAKLSETLTLRITPDLKEKLKAQAKAEDRSLNAVIRRHLERGVAAFGKRKRRKP